MSGSTRARPAAKLAGDAVWRVGLGLRCGDGCRAVRRGRGRGVPSHATRSTPARGPRRLEPRAGSVPLRGLAGVDRARADARRGALVRGSHRVRDPRRHRLRRDPLRLAVRGGCARVLGGRHLRGPRRQPGRHARGLRAARRDDLRRRSRGLERRRRPPAHARRGERHDLDARPRHRAVLARGHARARYRTALIRARDRAPVAMRRGARGSAGCGGPARRTVRGCGRAARGSRRRRGRDPSRA